jgi:AcrR family transcriptional regulator
MNQRRRTQNDLRFIKAEHVIRSSFICLIAEAGFEELSVTGIVTKAHIGRGTFYLHYKDKYDLLHTFEKEITADMQEIIRSIQTAGLEAVRQITIKLFTYFEDNITIMQALFGQKGDLGFQNRIKEMVWYAEFSKIFVRSIREFGSAVPLEYLASYIESSINSLFLTWLRKENRESPEEITGIIMELMLTTMRSS